MNRMLNYLRREPGKAQQDASPTDQQLLQQYLDSRDEAAFGELVRRHELSVLKACRQVLRSAVDVDDAFQATFLVLLRRARQIRWQPSLKSWLVAVAHRIAVRLAISQQRTQRREKNVIPATSTTTPLADVSWQEACSVLHEELNRLPDSFRLPLLLCYLQGYSRDEAAELLGWKLGSVKGGLERGRNLLRQRLERRGVTLSAGLFTVLVSRQATEAATLSPLASTMAMLTGKVSARVVFLSHSTGWVGGVLSSRLALTALILLIGSAAGVTLTWAKTADDFVVSTANASVISPVTASSPDHPAITVNGIVVDSASKHAAGASILVFPLKHPKPGDSTFEWPKPETGTTTDAEGRFQLTVKHSEFHLLAQKPGHGLDFVVITAGKVPQQIKMQLGEEMPIQGIVLDEEQKPVEGVTLGIRSIAKLNGAISLEDALKEYQTTNKNLFSGFEVNHLRLAFSSILNTKSDAQGKFILNGVSQGMMPDLAWLKPGMVSKAVNIVLLPGFADQGTTRHQLNAANIGESKFRVVVQPVKGTNGSSPALASSTQRALSYPRLFEGNKLTIHLERGVIVEGTVRNTKGEPVAGIGITTTGGLFLKTVSDAQGQYRFTGVAPMESYLVQTYPHHLYLPAQGSAVHRDQGPIKVDLLVRSGSVLRGQVIDGKTGKGIRSRITVQTTPTNPLRSKPDFQQPWPVVTEDDGTFRLIAPPGDIMVTASPVWDEQSINPMPYIPAKILPSHQSLLSPGIGIPPDLVHFQGTGHSFHLQNAYQLLELPTDRETTVELILSRGLERALHLVDPLGQPVDSALIVGLDQQAQAYDVKKSTMSVVGLQPEEKPRNVFIINHEKKLGAYLSIDTTNTKPLVVKLEPLGSMSGQFLDVDSKPYKHQEIYFQPTIQSDWRPNSFTRFFPRVTTDQDGRVTITDLIPDLKYVFYETDAFKPSLGTPKWNKDYLIQPGQRLDLGVMKMGQEPRRK